MTEKDDHMENIIYLTKSVYLCENDDFVKSFIRKITKETDDPLTMYLNTIGGESTDGLGIASMMINCKRPVHVIVMGRCYSAGTLILLGAQKRSCYKHSRFMFHDIRKYCDGFQNNKELSVSQDILKKWQSNIKDFYKSRLPEKTYKKVSTAMNSGKDWYFYGDEALRLGIIDEIIG